MIIKTCKLCKKQFETYPCRLGLFCSKHCANKFNWSSNGRLTAYKKGHVPSSKLYPEIMKSGTGHYAWKGEEVSYRGLHYWLRRKKGNPVTCSKCGSTKNVQWANIYHKDYSRILEDYVELCASCHKLYDLHG